MSKITVKFITLGCKTNLYESEAMAQLFREAGHRVVSGREPAEVCIINTCAVTGVGAQKSRQQIRRARRENPGAVLAVTGCLAQTDAARLREEIPADILLGTKRRDRIVELAERALRGEKIDWIEDIRKEKVFEELGVTRAQSRIRANLKIQDGCDNFCSYCIIPYARGPVRSRPLNRVLQEAEVLGSSGYGELVLTGIQIGAYGRDLGGPGLIDALEAIHRIPGIQRIRLGSLEPAVITPEFVQGAAALPKLCPQFHLALQSGCDRTLRRMNRRYTTAEYRNAVSALRKRIPDTAITTDIMAGFPGETPEDFRESLEFCREMGFARMHVFPYSLRQGTAAAKFPQQVNAGEKERRAGELLALEAAMRENFCRNFLGRTLPVLLEQRKQSGYHGTAANYMEIRVPGPPGLEGKIVRVRLTRWEKDSLLGEITNTEEEII